MKPVQVEYRKTWAGPVQGGEVVISRSADLLNGCLDKLKADINFGNVTKVILIGPHVIHGWRIRVTRDVNFTVARGIDPDSDEAEQARARIVRA